MVLKKARQDKILDLIRRYEIETQEEMLLRLKESGYMVTQATVSRDIRELNLIKGISARGVYCYTLPQKKENTFYLKCHGLKDLSLLLRRWTPTREPLT